MYWYDWILIGFALIGIYSTIAAVVRWGFRQATPTADMIAAGSEAFRALTLAALGTSTPATPEPATVTYAIQGAPPTGRTVRDQNGNLWTRHSTPLTFDPDDGEDLAHFGQWGVWRFQPDPFTVAYERPWYELLARYGPVTLEPLTDEEIASETLYGPVTARWGNPDEPCPYREHLPGAIATGAMVAGPWVGCSLGVGHIGWHRDDAGNELRGQSDAPLVPAGDTSITPAEASRVPCTCGHPERHRPDCARYPRISGGF